MARSGSRTVVVMGVPKDANGDIAVKVLGDDGEYWYSSVAESSLEPVTSPPVLSEPLVVVTAAGSLTVHPPRDGEDFARAVLT